MWRVRSLLTKIEPRRRPTSSWSIASTVPSSSRSSTLRLLRPRWDAHSFFRSSTTTCSSTRSIGARAFLDRTDQGFLLITPRLVRTRMGCFLGRLESQLRHFFSPQIVAQARALLIWGSLTCFFLLPVRREPKVFGAVMLVPLQLKNLLILWMCGNFLG